MIINKVLCIPQPIIDGSNHDYFIGEQLIDNPGWPSESKQLLTIKEAMYRKQK
jgi:hypothetical protein